MILSSTSKTAGEVLNAEFISACIACIRVLANIHV